MQPEAKLLRRIQRYLDSLDQCWYCKIHGGDNPFQEVGLPDLLVCYRGRFIGLEVKLRGGASPRQKVVLRRIAEAGGIGEVVHSVEEVERVLERTTRK